MLRKDQNDMDEGIAGHRQERRQEKGIEKQKRQGVNTNANEAATSA